ncbi:MAG: tannase/feruloyl esterase family alpha/beta hydrolase, partial [Clostridia bacterium]|nr:tannase/feruloyl esterase family alpha/beta hydrolase [Clostridia bacterium]
AGGKMIAFSGGSDPCVPYPDAMQYYNRAAEAMGGYEKIAEFFRFFVYAGRDHGMAGRGVNVIWDNETDKGSLLDAVRAWREKGIAPSETVGARIEQIDGEAQLLFARKTYPYKADKAQGKDFSLNCDSRYLKQ